LTTINQNIVSNQAK